MTSKAGETTPRYHVTVTDHAQVAAIGDNNDVDVFMERRRTSWPVVIGSFPPLASAFQIRAATMARMADQRAVVLSGGGGVGKSQIATQIFTTSTADLRVWITAGSRAAVIASYVETARQLDLAEAETDPERLAALVLGFLASTDRPWLVVLDDLWDPADLFGLWPAGQGVTIATTRRRDASLSGGGRDVVDVDVFTPEEGVNYLTARLLPHMDALPVGVLGAATELGEALGWLPLALAQAAGVIRDDGIACGTYLRRFHDRATRLTDLFPAQADADAYTARHQRTAATTWMLAVEVADRLEPMGIATPMAKLISVFDSAGAPEEAFLSSSALAWFLLAPELDTVSRDVARGALRTLDRLSLVVHHPDSEDPRSVRMHSLTGRAVQQSIAPEDLAWVVELGANSLLGIWPDVEKSTSLSEAFRSSVGSLRRACPEALLDDEMGLHPVLIRLGDSLTEAGLVGSTIAYWEDLAREVEQRFGPAHHVTMGVRVRVAVAHMAAGRLDVAIDQLQRWLDDNGPVHDPEGRLKVQNNLASAYKAAGQFDPAIALYERTLADREALSGKDHPATQTVRANLAATYRSAGRPEEAVELFEHTLKIRATHGPSDHDPEVFVIQNNLALALGDAGRHDEAHQLLQVNLTDRERVLGAEHPDTLRSRSGLAHSYASLGQLKKAIQLQEVVLRDRERLLGSDHPDTLLSRDNLGYYLQLDGRLPEAIVLHEQALMESERSLSANNPQTHLTRVNLAAAYAAAERFDDAIPLYEQIAVTTETSLGADHPETLATQTNLAAVYAYSGRLADATTLLARSQADHERVLGVDHPHTITVVTALAGAFLDAGEPERALPLFEQVLASMERTLGASHPDTLTIRQNLAIAYRAIGRLDDQGDLGDSED